MAFSDDFNRANEDLSASANWTVVTGASTAAAIVSNQLDVVTTQSAGLIVCPDQGDADHFSEYTLLDTYRHSFVVIRATDGSNFIGARGWDGKYQLIKRDAGTETVIGDWVSSPVSGDTVRIEAEGNTVRLLVNGTERISVTESFNNTETRQGVSPKSSNSSPWIDTFSAGVMAAAASITPTDATPNDGDLQTITGAGMTGPVTAASIGGLDILADLSGTDPTVAITFTVDVSATTTSTGMPRIGETSTISFTTATDGAVTTDVVIQPKTGWTITTGASIDHTVNGWAETVETDLGLTLVDGNSAYQSAARGEALTPAFVYTGGTTVAYQGTDFVVQQGGSATTTATSEGDAFYPFGTGPVVDAPVLASTKSLSGITDSSFSKTLTIQSGDAATSWAINGGADQAEYTLSNAGVLARAIPNPLEEAEVVTVAATNSGGTSNTQTVTITYSTSTIPKTKFRRFPWQSWNPL